MAKSVSPTTMAPAEGGDQHLAAQQSRPVRQEQEAPARRRPRQGGGVDGQGHDEQRQQRHEDAVHRLDPALHAAGDHEHGRGENCHLPADRLARVADEAGEVAAVAARRRVPEGACQGAEEVLQGPAGDDRVVAEDEKAGGDGEPAGEAPVRGGRGALVGGHRIALGAAAERQFGDHDGRADQGDADQVDDEKGAAAVLPGDVGEPPDVAQTDGGADGRQHEAPSRGPGLPLCRHASSAPLPVVRWTSTADSPAAT